VSLARAILIWRITALALAAIYAVAGIYVLLDDRDAHRTALWVAFFLGGAVLIVIGQRVFAASPTLAGILVSVGAAAGAFFLFPLLLPPIAAAVVIALSVTIARQTSTAT
jgi:hypothetical protein